VFLRLLGPGTSDCLSPEASRSLIRTRNFSSGTWASVRRKTVPTFLRPALMYNWASSACIGTEREGGGREEGETGREKRLEGKGEGMGEGKIVKREHEQELVFFGTYYWRVVVCSHACVQYIRYRHGSLFAAVFKLEFPETLSPRSTYLCYTPFALSYTHN